MLSQKVHIKVINVELTDDQNLQIIKKLTPLTRLVNGGRGAVCDVVIRKITRTWSGVVYCVLVRLETDTQTYYAVSNSHRFSRAISQVRSELRRTMSKEYFSDVDKVKYMQQEVHRGYFSELFVQ